MKNYGFESINAVFSFEFKPPANGYASKFKTNIIWEKTLTLFTKKCVFENHR